MARKNYVSVTAEGVPTQTRGDWVVKVGTGRGMKVVSHHRQKSNAIKRGKQKARGQKGKHGSATLYIGNKPGNGRGRYLNYGDS